MKNEDEIQAIKEDMKQAHKDLEIEKIISNKAYK